MVNVANLSVIMTNATIVSGIDLSYLNFPSDKQKRKPFEINNTEKANRIAFLSLICYYRMKQP